MSVNPNNPYQDRINEQLNPVRLSDALDITFDEILPREHPNVAAQSDSSAIHRTMTERGYTDKGTDIGPEGITMRMASASGLHVELKISADADYRSPRDREVRETRIAKTFADINLRNKLFGVDLTAGDESAVIDYAEALARMDVAKSALRPYENLSNTHGFRPQIHNAFGSFDVYQLLGDKRNTEKYYTHLSRPTDFDSSIAEAAVTLVDAGRILDAKRLINTMPVHRDRMRAPALAHAYVATAGDEQSLATAIELRNNLDGYLRKQIDPLLYRATGDDKYFNAAVQYASEQRITGIYASDFSRLNNVRALSALAALKPIAEVDPLKIAKQNTEFITDVAEKAMALVAISEAGDDNAFSQAVELSKVPTSKSVEVHAAIALAVARKLRAKTALRLRNK